METVHIRAHTSIEGHLLAVGQAWPDHKGQIDGQTYTVRGFDEPPPASVIGESELRDALRLVYRPPGWEPEKSDPKLPNDESEKATYLAEPPHFPAKYSHWTGSSFDVPEGKSIRFVIETSGKRYVSPIFKP